MYQDKPWGKNVSQYALVYLTCVSPYLIKNILLLNIHMRAKRNLATNVKFKHGKKAGSFFWWWCTGIYFSILVVIFHHMVPSQLRSNLLAFGNSSFVLPMQIIPPSVRLVIVLKECSSSFLWLSQIRLQNWIKKKTAKGGNPSEFRWWHVCGCSSNVSILPICSGFASSHAEPQWREYQKSIR